MTRLFALSTTSCTLLLLATATFGQARLPRGDADAAPSSNIMARTLVAPSVDGTNAHALIDNSMFAIAPPELRVFHEHDLIEIIVRESSKAESEQELTTEKGYRLNGAVTAWPDLNLADLLRLNIEAGSTTGLPRVGLTMDKDFDGEGEYTREDSFTARLSAEVITVLPNQNLVLEARTTIVTDEEQSTIRVTGVCRPIDVTAANTILSTQLHDLKIEKVNRGELKKAGQKGLIAKVLDTLFAF